MRARRQLAARKPTAPAAVSPSGEWYSFASFQGCAEVVEASCIGGHFLRARLGGWSPVAEIRASAELRQKPAAALLRKRAPRRTQAAVPGLIKPPRPFGLQNDVVFLCQ